MKTNVIKQGGREGDPIVDDLCVSRTKKSLFLVVNKKKVSLYTRKVFVIPVLVFRSLSLRLYDGNVFFSSENTSFFKFFPPTLVKPKTPLERIASNVCNGYGKRKKKVAFVC